MIADYRLHGAQRGVLHYLCGPAELPLGLEWARVGGEFVIMRRSGSETIRGCGVAYRASAAGVGANEPAR
jgi:hypothetical protein